ncbi:GNAT family N-acetyltransferase [Ramlibacter sp. AN1133]|uniref:GNAT family N-acetyltransferase n=1 Tax=Ramlibacter sp. AN1133 TaxID=3133429 RepID=UPI0030BB85E2
MACAMPPTIRPVRGAERGHLLALWERAVRATHHFLAAHEITALGPLVAAELASEQIDWWVLAEDRCEPIGFIGIAPGSIEALFVDPVHHGRGVGTALVMHAQRLLRGSIRVDVNEQNAAALRFYERLGFRTIDRSPVDSAGRPFPLVHMLRRWPGA